MILKLSKNVQIISALIWAAAILACSFIAPDSKVGMVLVTAAGFHFVLMTQFINNNKQNHLTLSTK